MHSIPCFQVDAFSKRPFFGNPAAVCLLDEWLPEATMQSMAAENALSETAFCVPTAPGHYQLRWFTPLLEVDLCGHATLATAQVIFEELKVGTQTLRFETRSGELSVQRMDGGQLQLDFPSRPAMPSPCPEAVAACVPATIVGCWKARDLILELDSAESVRALKPDLTALAALQDIFAVCVTARGTGRDDDVDFVSRFFAPAKGVPEDPVTGSAHCSLAPLWVQRLGRNPLRARQVGPRPGDLLCEVRDTRVLLTGSAVTVKRGVFVVPKEG